METIYAFTSFSIYVSKTCPRRLSNYHHTARNRIHIRTLVYRVTKQSYDTIIMKLQAYIDISYKYIYMETGKVNKFNRRQEPTHW